MFSLPKPQEHFISVDNFPIWRQHVAWSRTNGVELRDHTTQRFAVNMVFMSLLLGSEVGVLFSPSKPADVMREHLFNAAYEYYDFWAGLVLCGCIPLTLSTLVATFTAWAVVSVVSDRNSHVFLRSSVGLYAAQLPSRLIVCSIYLFLLWVILFLWTLLPRLWATVITVVSASLFVYVVSFYSRVGRLVMYAGAMGNKRILTTEEEESMMPWQLYCAMLEKAKNTKSRKSYCVVTHYRDYDPRFSINGSTTFMNVAPPQDEQAAPRRGLFSTASQRWQGGQATSNGPSANGSTSSEVDEIGV